MAPYSVENLVDRVTIYQIFILYGLSWVIVKRAILRHDYRRSRLCK